MEDRFRKAEGQYELFEEEEFQEDREAAKAFRIAVFAILAVVGLLFALPAISAPIRTHACYKAEDAAQLMGYVAEHSMEGYTDFVQPFLADGRCTVVNLPGPSPHEPLVMMHNGEFRIGIYQAFFEGGVVGYAVLMSDIRKHPKFAQAI